MTSPLAIGTVITFGGATLGKIKKASLKEASEKIDATALDSQRVEYLLSLPNQSLDLEIIGKQPPPRGASGDIQVAPPNGGLYQLPYAGVESVEVTLEAKGAVESKVSFCPLATFGDLTP